MQSHPSIYVLDTPGVLSPIVATDDYASKLALTGKKSMSFHFVLIYLSCFCNAHLPITEGAIKDSTLQDGGLVEFFLSVLNFSGKYNSWKDSDDIAELVSQKKSRKHHSDHTDVWVIIL